MENLKRLKTVGKAVRKYRENKRERGSPSDVCKRGRPSLEQQGHKVKEATIDYFESRGAADSRRQTESLEACLTLDKMCDVLFDEYGLDLKRSTTASSAELHDRRGKRHHDCAPVKMLRPQNDLMKTHADGHFASATIRHMKVSGKRNHVLQTQYTLQIRKCTSNSCCGEASTNFRAILPDGLLPPPVPFKKTSKDYSN